MIKKERADFKPGVFLDGKFVEANPVLEGEVVNSESQSLKRGQGNPKKEGITIEGEFSIVATPVETSVTALNVYYDYSSFSITPSSYVRMAYASEESSSNRSRLDLAF